MVAGACSGGGSSSPEEAFEKARAAFRQGDFPAALRLAEQGASRASNGSRSAMYWRLQLLRTQILLAQTELASAEQVLQADLAAEAPRPALAARRMMLEGYLASRRERWDEARAHLARAHRTATAHGAAEVLIETNLLRGRTYSDQGRPTEAEPFFRDALERARREQDVYHQAAATLNLGTLRLGARRYDEAVAYFEEASRLAERAQGGLVRMAALENLSLSATELGDFESAADTRHAVIDLQRNAGASLWLVQSQGWMGDLYMRKGEPGRAISWYRDAIAGAREIGHEGERARWTTELSSALGEARQWTEAAAVNREALALQRQVGRAQGELHAILYGAAIAAGQGRHEAATAAYEHVLSSDEAIPPMLGEAHAGLGRVLSQTAHHRQAQAHFEAALDLIEQARTELARTEFKLSFSNNAIRFYRDYVDDLVSRGDEVAAFEVVESARARVLADRLRASEPAVSPSTDRAVLDTARSAAEVVLSYWVTPRRSYLWVVTPGALHHVTLPGEARITALVERYRDLIERSVRDPLTAEVDAGRELYRWLIAPAAPYIPAGAQVLILPDGPLHNLNFETLPVPGEPPRYWLEDVTLAVAPSLRLLSASDRPPRDVPRLWLIGDPVPAPGIEPLPHAAREMASIGEHWRSRRVTRLDGAAATPEAYVASSPGEASIIHFATHAEANPQSPLDSAILLSTGSQGYKLYGHDVLSARLTADLVTLSACRSAGARLYAGEGLVGFAWAFMDAGAANVIAGLWEVSDRSTAELMDHLYAGLAAGEPPAVALRAAKLSLARSTGNFRKPYYWAPFQLYTRHALPVRRHATSGIPPVPSARGVQHTRDIWRLKRSRSWCHYCAEAAEQPRVQHLARPTTRRTWRGGDVWRRRRAR